MTPRRRSSAYRPLAGPFRIGKVARFGYRFAIRQEAFVDMIAEIAHRLPGNVLANLQRDLIRWGQNDVHYLARLVKASISIKILYISGTCLSQIILNIGLLEISARCRPRKLKPLPEPVFQLTLILPQAIDCSTNRVLDRRFFRRDGCRSR